MMNICAAQILVGYFLTKQLESMKPERCQMTNLKDLTRMHLAYWEAFCFSEGKNNPPNYNQAQCRCCNEAGCEDQRFSAF